MTCIVFISSMQPQLQEQWVTHLNNVLVDETILLPEQLTAEQEKHVDVAIVANPNVAVLQQFPALKWVQSVWAGVETLVNQIDIAQLKLVRLIDPQLAITMAESVLAWTLYLHKNMPLYREQQNKKQWLQHPVTDSSSKRVGVLGVGALGEPSIEILKKFGFQVSCWSRSLKDIAEVKCYSGEQGLLALLRGSDILINLLPLTKQTTYLLNDIRLRELPSGSSLINFSRGAVIDTGALMSLLDNGHISHAVLDVFEQEPLAENSPIWSHPNITVLPHISAPTNIVTASAIVANNVKRYRQTGIIPRSVDHKLGY